MMRVMRFTFAHAHSSSRSRRLLAPASFSASIATSRPTLFRNLKQSAIVFSIVVICIGMPSMSFVVTP